MKKKYSRFKNPGEDTLAFKNWVQKLEQANAYAYDQFSIQTSLGKTQIYGFNTLHTDLDTLVIFPGFRTTTLIWDIDQGLKTLAKELRIFLVETNGQPNLSDGNSPGIRSLDYGRWGAEVFKALNLESAFIAGASFGGLVCMKIALVIPEKIKSAFLLNPGCFRMISFGMKNMYYNLLPMLRPTNNNIRTFLNKVIFCKPEHQLSPEGEDLLVEYLTLALTKYKDNTEKPYYMGHQLDEIKVDTYLMVGEQDILIPPEKSIRNAKKHLKEHLKSIQVYKDVGHGVECYQPCIAFISDTIKTYNISKRSK